MAILVTLPELLATGAAVCEVWANTFAGLSNNKITARIRWLFLWWIVYLWCGLWLYSLKDLGQHMSRQIGRVPLAV